MVRPIRGDSVGAEDAHPEQFDNEWSPIQATTKTFADYASPTLHLLKGLPYLGAALLVTGFGFSRIQFGPSRDRRNPWRVVAISAAGRDSAV
jgi:hypothetical protein